MVLSKRVWIVISALSWFAIGVLLLFKGLKFVIGATVDMPLMKLCLPFAKTHQQAELLIICVGLLIGFIKGRTVLAKTVARIADRIEQHEGALTVAEVYDRKYWIILCLMMSLGFIFKTFSIPNDIRGGIDIAVGSALINGAMLYLRRLFVPKRT